MAWSRRKREAMIKDQAVSKKREGKMEQGFHCR
jgi:hypothetical protein